MTGTTSGGPGPSTWHPTPALVAAVAVALVLLGLAVAEHRPAAAVLAAPLLAEVAWWLRPTTRRPVAASVRAAATRLQEGDTTVVTVGLDVPPDADVVTIRLELRPLLQVDEQLRPLALRPRSELRFDAAAEHFGRGPAGQVYLAAWAAHGLLAAEPVAVVGDTLDVEPVARPGTAGPMPRLTAIVGPRPSRRPGSGSEFASVRPFVTGDRLRRVNWPVTARRGELHVTTTTADRDAVLLLVVDSTSEVGPTGETSLDVAVRAAAALARRHLHQGDRVGLLDLAEPAALLRAGAGHRQLQRVLDRLLTVRRRAPGDLRSVPRLLARAAPDAVVVVLTPLLRAHVGASVGELAQLGRPVLVVDTLPEPTTARTALSLAERLQRLEQEATVDQLIGLGVPVVRWDGGTALERALLGLTRVAPRRRTS